MSCYNWEHGELIIPSAEWAGLKAAVRERYNELQSTLYEAATDAHERLVEAGKGERGFDYRHEARAIIRDALRRHGVSGGVGLLAVERSLFWREGEAGWRERPLTPRKKDFDRKTNRDTQFRCGEASIRFDNDDRQATWHVPENNRAVERAHEHPVATAFFRALGRIDWTRNSGGVITGNDEYNQDSYGAGDGANYVNASYGPRGQRRAGYRTDRSSETQARRFRGGR